MLSDKGTTRSRRGLMYQLGTDLSIAFAAKYAEPQEIRAFLGCLVTPLEK